MSRFTAPDLSLLPPPQSLEKVSFEDGLSLRMEDLKVRSEAVGVPYTTGHLRTDPLRLDQETSMDREVQVRARVNDGIKAVMLISTYANNLDHIAQTYYQGMTRLPTRVDSNGVALAYETDEEFKERVQLAPEGFSIAGPGGAYEYHALEVNGRRAVSKAAAYSEEDGALYRDGSPVLAPETLVIIVPHASWLDDEAWTTDMALGPLVSAALSARTLRPIGDKVTVYVAERAPYSVNATLHFLPGADVSLAVAEAEKSIRDYAARQRRSGGVIERVALGGSLKQAGVSKITLDEPAQDFDPGSHFAPDLEAITITPVFEERGFR